MFDRIQRKPFLYIPMAIGGVFLAGLLAFLLGLVVMLLWNWLMPVIFGLPTITYWQGWGLVLLAHILFKAGPHRYDHDHEEHREWKTRFRDRIKKKFAEKEEGPEEKGEESPSEDD
jgi:hypothetical protein